MVEQQLRARGIRDKRILAAFEDVPRERFVPDGQLEDAYRDSPLPIGQGQTISQPYIVALMLQELDVHPTDKVLDVGLGSGYQTALLAALARHVYAVERIGELAERSTSVLQSLEIDNVTVRTGDGTLGWPEEAPFDRIISGAAGPDVPRPWLKQLDDNGRIVTPVGTGGVQSLKIIEKVEGDVYEREFGEVRFVKLIGEQGWSADEA
jgi:protein-L-isoaspartate(D-aspartate) O-methyltransferase